MPPVPQYKESDTDWTTILPKKELQRAHVQKMVTEVFKGERKRPVHMMLTSDDYFADCSKVDRRIQVVHTMRMMLPNVAGFPVFNLELEVVVETKGPVNLTAPFDVSIPWEIRTIRVLRAATAQKILGPT